MQIFEVHISESPLSILNNLRYSIWLKGLNGADDAEDDDDDVPDLVENFDEASKNEVPSASAKDGDADKEE